MVSELGLLEYALLLVFRLLLLAGKLGVIEWVELVDKGLGLQFKGSSILYYNSRL